MMLRFVTACLAGALLSMAGSCTQLSTANDLSSPSTLGFESLAVAVVLFVYLIFPSDYWQYLSLLLFFLIAAIFFLAAFGRKTKKRSLGKNEIILIGLGINLFIGGVFSLLYFLHLSLAWDFPSHIWFGHFRFLSWHSLGVFLIPFCLIYSTVFLWRKKLALLVVSEELVLNLGLNLKDLRTKALFIAFLAVGPVVCLYGVFSFLSLVFPQILRSFKWFRTNPARELVIGPWPSGLLFAGMDWLCYELPFYGSEIPVSMLSTIVGSGCFLWLLVKRQRRVQNLPNSL